jgi:hypothetical protein
LYSQHETLQREFLGRLMDAETIRNDLRSAMFWPTIGNGVYTSTTVASSIRDPRVRLTHRCISYSLSGRQSSTHRITGSDLFFLYTIYSPNVYCNIPFWVASYLKGELGRSRVIRFMEGCSSLGSASDAWDYALAKSFTSQGISRSLKSRPGSVPNRCSIV